MATTTTPTRDAGIDLVRALCVIAVVTLHALQVSVTVRPAGPVLEYATVGADWYPPVTWFLQVMPLFFVVGGFAAMHGYAGMRGRGSSTGAFVAGRVHRLLAPALLPLTAVGLALPLLRTAGVPLELLRSVGIRDAEPFWFLGVFLGCQALVPAMLALHARAPRATLIGLTAGAVLVDLAHRLPRAEAIGYLDVVLVWTALQQVGFFLADGTIDALSVLTRVMIGGTAFVLLAGSLVAGVHSYDLIANLNPPTSALLLIGAVQTTVVSLLRERLRNLSRQPVVGAFVDFVTARTMTIYLWHMPALLVMSGTAVLWALDGALTLPVPSSGPWWSTRPLWLASAFAASAVVALLLGNAERGPGSASAPSPVRSVAAVLLGCTAVLVVVTGVTPLRAAAGVVLILSALVLARSSRTATSGRSLHRGIEPHPAG
jgi:fucose 4-O-acetylase-like acetyltransferase